MKKELRDCTFVIYNNCNYKLVSCLDLLKQFEFLLWFFFLKPKPFLKMIRKTVWQIQINKNANCFYVMFENYYVKFMYKANVQNLKKKQRSLLFLHNQ